MKVLVASGWYCNTKSQFFEASRRRWLSDIQDTFGVGAEILIVDNASPLHYPVHLLDDQELCIDFIKLNQNAGHAKNLLNGNTLCGWHASVIVSLAKFLTSNYDLYVYVEQDVVLQNLSLEDFYTSDIALGRSIALSQPIQQSVFAISKTYARKFLSRLLEFQEDDYQLSCERKFAIAASKYYRVIPSNLFRPFHDNKKLPFRLINILQSLILRILYQKDFLSIPGGRDRKNLGEKYYLQQLTDEEMYRYYHEYL